MFPQSIPVARKSFWNSKGKTVNDVKSNYGIWLNYEDTTTCTNDGNTFLCPFQINLSGYNLMINKALAIYMEITSIYYELMHLYVLNI